jgi:DNA-binding LacI/PurR family transcriptional regulator
MMAMAVRLRDVAEHAGVSVKTVSNVVHDHPAVSRAMRTRVQESIAVLGYVPNISARSLRTGRSGLIGLAVPRVSDPYFAQVSAAVIDAASTCGLSVLVEQTDGDPAREAEVLHGRRPTIVDGLIFSPIAVTPEVLDEAPPTVPLVLIGEHLMSAERSRVAMDNVAAAEDGVRHLVEVGCRRIAVIGAKRGSTAATAELRLVGHRRGLARAGLGADPSLEVEVAEFSRECGCTAVEQLVASRVPFDGLLCFTDLLALGAMEGLTHHGIRVPGDVAVVGFDDIDEGRHCAPTLTTVAPDVQLLAMSAVMRLVTQLDVPKTPRGDSIVVPHRLVVRDSTRRSRGT